MTQQLFHSKDVMQELSDLMKEKKFERVLLVTGIHFSASDLKLIKNVPSVFHLVYESAILGIDEIKFQFSRLPWQPAAVFAIGGGRIIDAAKLIILQMEGTRPFFVAIPTTAGSGSEATPFAVAYSGKEKKSISSSVMLPDLVYLAPELLKSLSSRQRSISAIDAVAQSIESIWNIHATPSSINDAAFALKTSWHIFNDFVNRPDSDFDARMLEAAHFSGKAIAITRTTGCHALSYYLTANHGVPHGQAVGFFLPVFFIYNDHPSVAEKLALIYQILGVNNSLEACKAVQKLMASAGLAVRFSDMGLTVDINELLQSSNKERFANNPVPYNKQVLEQLIVKYIM